MSLGIVPTLARAAGEPVEILYDQSAIVGRAGAVYWVLGVGFTLLLVVGYLFRQLVKTLRQREADLQMVESRLREAQRVARMGSWSRDFETGKTFWSEEALEILGLEGSTEDFRHYERMIHPDDLEQVTEVIARAYYKGGSYQCDHRIIGREGQAKYVRLRGQVFLGDSLSPVRETGTVQDISDRYQADQALRRSERRLESILDAMPYPVLILENADSQHALYGNRSTFELFGIDAGLSIDALNPRELWAEPGTQDVLLKDALAHRSVLHREMRARTLRGRQFWVDVSAIPMDFAGVDALLLLLIDITERKHINDEIERLATTDALTGVLNRRSLLNLASKELRRSLRHRHPFTMMLMDIDNLKYVNDRYGHRVGDDVIRRFVEVVNSCLREEDLLGRIGGNEFCVVLVSSVESGGYLVAERIRKRWLDESFALKGGERTLFTCSIGVAMLHHDRESVDEVLERADNGLRAAKKAGRNCVIVFSGEGPDSCHDRPA